MQRAEAGLGGAAERQLLAHFEGDARTAWRQPALARPEGALLFNSTLPPRRRSRREGGGEGGVVGEEDDEEGEGMAVEDEGEGEEEEEEARRLLEVESYRPHDVTASTSHRAHTEDLVLSMVLVGQGHGVTSLVIVGGRRSTAEPIGDEVTFLVRATGD